MAHPQEPLALVSALADIAGLEQQADEFDAQAASYTKKAEAVRQIIGGIKALNGSAEAVLTRRFEAHKTTFETRPFDAQGPRGPKAVLSVIREHPARRWKVVEVKREMLRRGWAPTPKAVEASIKRLRETGELVEAGYGHYKLPPQADPPQSLVEEVAA
jgi:hypothetical protein